MQKYQDVVLNQNGNPVSGVQVTVTDLAGSPVAVYSSNAIGLNVNPLTSDNNGRFSFYAPDGRYSLTFTFGGNVVASITDILLEDPMDGSDAVFNDVTILGELSDASKITSAAVGGISATNVQDALSELDSDKASNADLSLKVNSADLAAPGGSALVGYGSGTVEQALQDHDAALENVEGNLNFTTLPSASLPADDADLMLIRQGSENKKIAVSVIRSEFAADAEAAEAGAVAAKTAAEAARDATVVGAAPTVYATTAAGLTATTSGQYFSVPSADSTEYLILYLNNAGTAVEQKRYPSADAVLKIGSPFVATVGASNAGGSAELYGRMMRGVIDVRLYGVSASDTYYIERLRRNYSGNWHIAIKRTSDNATVVQYFSALTEPANPAEVQRVILPGQAVAGAFGYILIRWSEFAAGVINSGLTMNLRPECVSRMAPGPANQMPRSAARSNQVALPINSSEFVNVNETTRTVTWPEMRITDGLGNQNGAFRLGAGSVTFDAANQVAWLDLTEAATYGPGATIPGSVVKKAAYGNDTISPNDYHASPHQWPIAWSVGAGRVDVNPVLRAVGAATASVYDDDIVVKVDQANNIVSVYMRANGSDSASLTYIHYRLYHHVAADADVWTIDGIWEVQRAGYESFSTGKEISPIAVETLCALQEVGQPDFMGGRAHGDEVITQAPTLLIDGRAVSMTSGALSWFHAKEVTFIQSSKLYRVGSALSTALADRKLWLMFRDGDMVADQRIEHLTSYTLQAGYLAMIAPHRYETYVNGTSEDSTSAQISGHYADNVRMLPKDVTARQASQVADDYVYGVEPPVTRVKLWGGYGVECAMEVMGTNAEILRDVYYINRTSYAYNKAYIGFIGTISGNQSVTSADKWQITTKWSIRSKN